MINRDWQNKTVSTINNSSINQAEKILNYFNSSLELTPIDKTTETFKPNGLKAYTDYNRKG